MKLINFFRLLTLVLLLGVGFTGCDNVNDVDLEERATEIIDSNPDAADVTVSVTDKVATLSGTVEDEATKSSIQSSVSEVDGIQSVVNSIRVLPPSQQVEEPVIEEVEEVSDQVKVATRKGKLNVHDKPGVLELVITVVQHGEMLTLVEKESDEWWLIETKNGVKGYSYASYLEQQ